MCVSFLPTVIFAPVGKSSFFWHLKLWGNILQVATPPSWDSSKLGETKAGPWHQSLRESMDRSKEKTQFQGTQVTLFKSAVVLGRGEGKAKVTVKILLPSICGLSPGCCKPLTVFQSSFYKVNSESFCKIDCFLCFLGEAGPWMFILHHFHWCSCVLKFFFDGRVGVIYSLPKYNKDCINNLNYRPISSKTNCVLQ